MVTALDAVSTAPLASVRAGALVTIEDEEGEVQMVLVLPGAQGDRIGSVVVISPRAPLARALAGAETGDVRTLRRKGLNVDLEVVNVS